MTINVFHNGYINAGFLSGALMVLWRLHQIKILYPVRAVHSQANLCLLLLLLLLMNPGSCNAGQGIFKMAQGHLSSRHPLGSQEMHVSLLGSLFCLAPVRLIPWGRSTFYDCICEVSMGTYQILLRSPSSIFTLAAALVWAYWCLQLSKHLGKVSDASHH